MPENIQYTQQQIQAIFLPLLKEKGKVYQKSKNIFARAGVLNEWIETVTSDGKETQNKVKEAGSFVVKNQTAIAEEYIVLGADFHKRYELLKPAKDGFAEYQPKGKVIAVKMTRKLWHRLGMPEKAFHYEPSWGGSGVAKLYDYIVCPPDFSEVYRIARKEFWETYTKN